MNMNLVHGVRLVLWVITFFLFADPVGAADLKVMKTGLGSGMVTSSPAGISCGATCDATFGSVPVTLTAATSTTESTFAGWYVDIAGVPATVPGCLGMGTCTVSMSTNQRVRASFNLIAFPPLIGSYTPPMVTCSPMATADECRFSPEGIRGYLNDNLTVDSPAKFLKALPPQYKQNWIAMTRSESLQTGTATSPRILLYSTDAKYVFSLGLTPHTSYPESNLDAIEYMQWDNIDKNFRFHEIVVRTITPITRSRGVSIDDARCSKCHSTRNVLNRGTTSGTTGVAGSIGIVKAKNKPNWDTYDSWGGMLSFNRDQIYQGSVEAAAFRKIFNPWTWRTNDAVRAIIEQLEFLPSTAVTRMKGGEYDGHIVFDFDPPLPSPPPPPNDFREPALSGLGLSTRPDGATYSFDRRAGTASSTVLQNGLSVSLLNQRGNERGVDLFDILGQTLNAERVADELIDHKFATGSFPINVKPIALAISTGCITNPEGLFRSGMLGNRERTFFDVRNGMLFDAVATDTLKRRESLPRRKADIQKMNLSRTDMTNDPYLLGMGTTNGLIQEYGAATETTSASIERIRQEVFRRGEGNDRTVMATAMGGIYVDKEVYSASMNNQIALFRYFLEPLGVSVDKWSTGVRGRSRTYTFADGPVYGPFITKINNVVGQSQLGHAATNVAADCAALVASSTAQWDSLPDSAVPGDNIPKYTDVQRIFNKSCIECHGGLEYPPYANNPSGLDLSENEFPAALQNRLNRSHGMVSGFRTAPFVTVAGVETPRGGGPLYGRITDDWSLINATTPSRTVPYNPLTAGEDCPNFTRLMPCGGPPLSQVDILTIRRWIQGGRSDSTGDPHIKTIDGVNYDFQADGEFTLLRDTGIEIQARQTAVATQIPHGPNWHTGLTSCVSVNSAVAIRMGGHRITYQPGLSGRPNPEGLELRIDGKLTRMERSEILLPLGGRIMQTVAPGGIQIEAPGGAVIVITPGQWNNGWHLNLDMRHIRATEGIMGAIAPGNWLPALPDGSFLGERPDDRGARYKQLYGVFGNAWRVSNETALFDYADGTGTKDFTIESWPNGESPKSCAVPQQPGDPPAPPPLKPVALDVAIQQCKGIVAEDMRDNCVQDVRVTGDIRFAKTYLLTQQIKMNNIPTVPQLISPKDNATGLSKKVTFKWRMATDSDKDTITYRLCVWGVDKGFTYSDCSAVSSKTFLGISYAGLTGLGGSGLILGIALIFPRLNKRRRLLSLMALIIMTTTLSSCLWMKGTGWRGEIDTISKTVSGLKSGQAYYWKVIAEDGKGGTVESETRRFDVK